MRHLDLFSGIGGFSLAAQWVWGEEHEIVSFCEIDPFCQKVLKKHWPDVPIHDDIKTLRGDDFGTIDLITGGFPCQPFSCAGKQGGKTDDRYLWPEMFRVISEANPTWVIGENVTGIVNMELDNVLTDLEDQGFEVKPLIIPACATDAKHRRDRVWIVGHARSSRRGSSESRNNGFQMEQDLLEKAGRKQSTEQTEGPSEDVSDHDILRVERKGTKQQTARINECTWLYRCNLEPNVGRVAHGVPNRVDRLKGLGNAIDPYVAAVIMQAIKECNVDNINNT